MNIIPFYVAPHYKSDHAESELINLSVDFFIEHKMPFVALRDGEALVLDTKEPWNYRGPSAGES